MKLTARQIERLVKRGEVVHTECKDASGGLPDSLWESYSSFANTAGGTSDARNSHIFNIFALVDIGERSGTGLADLYGHWKKNNLPAPVIAEEYDPDRVKITVYTDSAQDPPKTRPRVPQNRPKVPQKCPRSAPEV